MDRCRDVARGLRHASVASRYGQHYALERFLCRLAASSHRDRFILKGALMLRVWEVATMRPTRDIDLLGRTANDPELIAEILRQICSRSCLKRPEIARSTNWPSLARVRPTLARSAACEILRQAAGHRESGAGGIRTPVRVADLAEMTRVSRCAQRRAQRGLHRGTRRAQDRGQRVAQRGPQFRPRPGRWLRAATTRPTLTSPNWWRRGRAWPRPSAGRFSRRPVRSELDVCARSGWETHPDGPETSSPPHIDTLGIPAQIRP